MAANPSFDLFKLPDEHNELGAVLRDLCEKEIAPYAADVDVDEHSRFPEEALKALNAAGFSAVHVPEDYGGQGADSVPPALSWKKSRGWMPRRRWFRESTSWARWG